MRYATRIERTAKTVGGRISALAVVVVAMLLGSVQTANAQPVTIPVITTRNWKIDVIPDATAKVAGRLQYEDYLFIEDTQITAFELNRLGFGPIMPSISVDASGNITFTANLSSRFSGTITMTGVMTATTLSGTGKWTKDGVVYNYTFSGVPYTPPTDVES
jgi:hypothetical protein